MHFTALLVGSSAFLSIAVAQSFQTSDKRGLVFVNNPKHPEDNTQWPPPTTDLTWYYNYKVAPSSMYSAVPQADFEFVPMLWTISQTFKDEIQTLVNSGRNISHILGFNEPDGESSTGGSGITAEAAAANWIEQVEPLREMGIKVGGPAVTGSQRGIIWLENFFTACRDLGSNCTIDFLPLHWYGNFEGLASFMGQIVAAYPNTTLWLTEYAFAHGNLEDSQSFFKTSAEYMDRLDFVGRYSYFGSFRSDISNVGPNAAMLDSKGQLTDIGAWYLGRAATGNIPSGPNGSSGAGHKVIKTGGLIFAAAVAGLFLL